MERWMDGIRALFFDLDGCIYFGGKLAERANDLLGLLREQGYRIGFITNNSRENAVEIRDKLSKMGLRLEAEMIFSATEAVAVFLKDAFGPMAVKTAGSESLNDALANAGHNVLGWTCSAQADAVVIGRDTEFNYFRLEQIVNEAARGARIISTNPDYSHPGEGGRLVPETGALLAAVESILGSSALSIGKPHAWLYELAMRSYDVKPAECVMIGDNLTTDIAGAEQIGMKTVWIQNDLHSQQGEFDNFAMVPTVIVNALSELYEMLLQENGKV
ncbi:acid sugar phosphatase [Paenibacillus montaniterrae]|uniref:Acid sugar phosphatase n=1 Tax=Paenibacillus montaniterrae TaxID=429341 RepID=A0A919YSQ9_9BACL|nr:HAD-IIA family hydrolase [Paenibacillus montaniterrae]GIP19393.1 acid sugar phosphatase [Paenibacillus montaniterrae]